MPFFRIRTVVGVIVGVAATGMALAYRELPALGASGLLHPSRRSLDRAARDSHPTVRLAGADVILSAWKVPARTARRGTILYLHGVADNRGSALTAAERFPDRGFDVVAYDSRAHGDSGGEICTYGFYEKRDLQRALDVFESGPVIVIGSSLGGAVALQAAAEDARISAVIAAESFSDLRTVAAERAPWFFTARTISQALALAGKQGSFRVDDVSPMAAARRIHVPVFLLHGAEDRETRPEHTRRIFAALSGRKRLLIVQGAGHNQSLQASAWSEIEDWIDSVLPGGDDRQR